MSRVYVGNLPLDIKERELDDLFYKYGRIRDIDIKNQGRPPAFAFIVFDDSRDAQDAIRGRDGYSFDGARLRVEMSKGSRGDRDRDRFSGRDRDRDERPRKTGGRRTDFGVVVSGLPRSCSWQDLKDYMRSAGDVVFADVDKRGEGQVDFSSAADMDRAVDTLDNSEFKNPFDTSVIRVRYANAASSSSSKRSSSRDRARPASRRHSSSRSPSDRSRSRDRDTRRPASSRSRSNSRSRSPSPAQDRKRSGSEDAEKRSNSGARDD